MLKLKVLIITIIGFVLQLSSQTQLSTDFKEYTFEIFPTGNIERLDIRAKHAQINLLNWEKDSISVETTIEILSDKPNLSKEMLKEVTIKKVAYGNTLQVKTNFIKEFNRTIPYKVVYNVFFPKKLALKIENSHGTVTIGNVEGGIDADISYCDINFNNFKQLIDSIPNHINLVHCKGKINHLGSSVFKSLSTTADILGANNIEAHTAYSLLTFRKLKSYKGDSKVDNLTFNAVKEISITSDNSTVLINQLDANGKFECKKGALTILNTSDYFNTLTINNFETPAQVHLNELSSYSINGEIINGNFSHPQTDKIQVIKDINNTSISGEVGSDPSSTSKVIVFNRNENIVFN